MPRWEPDGTESPVERTDPFLPVITDEVLHLPAVPTLDDQRLAGLIAELDCDDIADPAATSPAVPDPPASSTAIPEPAAGSPAVPTPAADSPAALVAHVEVPTALPARRTPSTALNHHPAAPLLPTPPRRIDPGRYVRRDYQPLELPADAMSLTGFTRNGGGRLGSILFTALFLAIFLLILIQAIVSVVTAAT